MSENEDLIDKIIYSPEVEERRYLMNELLELIPRVVVKKMEQKKEEVDKSIKEIDSDVTQVIIKPTHNKLQYWDEHDKQRVIKSITLAGLTESIQKSILEDVNCITS